MCIPRPSPLFAPPLKRGERSHAAVQDRTRPAVLPVGALTSLLSVPLEPLREGATAAWAALLTRPLRSRIFASACSLVMVGVSAGFVWSKLLALLAPEGVRSLSEKDDVELAFSSRTGTCVVTV